MEASEKLSSLGWNLSTEGLQQVSENGHITDSKKLVRNAMDLDLREISTGSFPEDVAKGKVESISGKIVVQVQKIRNIAAPKANEESRGAPRMLKLSVTDGVTICQAVEAVHIPSLSLNTPPGTKLSLKGKSIPVVHGIILLSPSNVEVLGGKVTALVDKWELNRSLAKHKRGQVGEEGGPPPWIPFGQKIVRTNTQDRNFKSLDGSKDKDHQDHAEFEAQRKDAIAEAARGGAKKVFGGGNKPLLDYSVQQLVDCGFGVDQAEYALRVTRNNVDRALRMLQKGEENRPKTRENDEPREERRERRKRGDRDEESGTAPKPSTRVSLFDFLEDKLPVQSEKEVAEPRNYGGGSSIGEKRFSDSSKNSSRTGQNQNRSSRIGRGKSNSSTWSDRGGQNSHRREERYDRNHHGLSQAVHPQKPPRFQNQQRYQQQEGSLHQQTWSQPQSFNDTTSNWVSRNQTINFKNQDTDYQNARDSSSGTMFDSRNRNSRSYSNRFVTDSSSSHFEDVGNSQPFARQDHIDLSAKLSSQHISRDVNNYQKPLNPMQTQNSIFPVDFGFKDSHIGGGFGGLYDTFGVGSETISNQYHAENKVWPWHKGDKCMAKYWEDNMYYNAEVTGVSQRTCVVRFLEYGNFEEVLQDDCIPFTEDGTAHTAASQTNQLPQHQNHFSGILEFRRGGSQPFMKSSADREGNPHRVQQQMYLPPAQRK